MTTYWCLLQYKSLTEIWETIVEALWDGTINIIYVHINMKTTQSLESFYEHDERSKNL